MWMDVFLDPARPRQTSAMLYEQIRAAVAEGRLRPGARLPTSRWLAHDLGVSRSTVAAVFGRLVAEGILDARVGDGTYVADHPLGGPGPSTTPSAVDLVRRAPTPAPPARVVPPVSIDLRTGRPDTSLFPLTAWRRAVREAAEQPPPGYGHPAGLPELRTALAAWVGRTRGLDVDARQVLVTAGAQQAFELCAQILLADGDVIAFEEPGYEPARRSFLAHGCTVQAVRVDRSGMAVDEIADDARAVYVTPSHQSPTGVTMSAPRRRALLERAHDQQMAIIEDDYDTEFRYVDRPLEPLHRLDSQGHVVYIGTFSKTLSPSLRIGFIVASHDVISNLTVARQTRDVQPPHLTQATLTRLIVTGGLDRHVRRTRAVFRDRFEVVRRRIDELHRDGLVSAPWPSNAGLHAMVELHEGSDSTRIRDELAGRGVVIDTTDEYWFGRPRPALTVGFGLADEARLDHAFDILADALRPSGTPT